MVAEPSGVFPYLVCDLYVQLPWALIYVLVAVPLPVESQSQTSVQSSIRFRFMSGVIATIGKKLLSCMKLIMATPMFVSSLSC